MTSRALPESSVVDFTDKGRWWKNRGIILLNICLLIPLMTSAVNGLDSSLINGLQILPGWQRYFHYPSGKLLGFINSAQFIGNLCGLPIAPFVSDIFGRRAGLFLGSLIMLAGVGLQTASANVATLIGARITIGFGLCFCSNAAPLLLIELSYPTQRGKITSMYNTNWYLGSIISAWACFGSYIRAKESMWSWRVPTLVQAFLPLVQVASVWFIPESPRWLISRGLEEKASKVLAKYHANGGNEHDPLVVFEVAQIRHAIKMEAEINRRTSYWSLFSTPGNRKRMMIIMAIAIFSQWSGNGLVSYYINIVLDGVGITSAAAKVSINGNLQIFNFLVALSASMLVDWAGRRTLFIVSNSGMLISFSAWTISTALYNTLHTPAAGIATIPLIFIFYFFYDIAYTPMVVAYTLEILPYRVRAKGFAIMNITLMLTVAFNQFVNPWALAAIGWQYYIVYCAWLIVELAFVAIFIVETKGRTLEETAALFDGELHRQNLVVLGEEAAAMEMSRVVVLPELKKGSQRRGVRDEYGENLKIRDLYTGWRGASPGAEKMVV
ncbi:hypothetical protein K443DRAFT_81386 [Laccaria amethystina LaAM-08-1]|uniref:Unplaced genomic scaffold K443scaffold_1, whole genome shotgun sequence n=1 Tax=Laccaria amethystina LaAM-08-1 TaxID=1095629 RepID=A0A0C9YPV6_9AGAR|nr:hypothetical protein K443DRAFT_81386 [Laccaria amethystina LaAM-08-1]